MKNLLLGISACVCSITLGHAAISVGLVEYWEFDGDLSAGVTSGHAGTLDTTGAGSGTFTAGKFGSAIDLQSSAGNQASVTVGGDENDFDFAGQSMSFSFWYTTDSLYVSWQTLLSKGDGNNYRVGRQSGNNTTLRMAPGTITRGSAFTLDNTTWYHAVGVFTYDVGSNTTTGTLYLNGVGTTAAASNLSASSYSLAIGRNPQYADRAWDGKIDDVAIWNRALTSEEVAEIYNGGTGASISSLVPEPSAVCLLGFGGMALLVRRRR